MKYVPLFFALASITTALCLITGCQERSAPARQGGGHNFLRGDAPRIERIPRNDGRQFLHDISDGAAPSVEKTTNYLFAFGVVAGVCIAIFLAFFGWKAWYQSKQEKTLLDPNVLFRELTQAHQLSDTEKRLLKQVSEKNSLSSPLEVFIEPKFLLDALESDSFVSARPSVKQLLSTLFDINHTGITPADSSDETILVTHSSLP